MKPCPVYIILYRFEDILDTLSDEDGVTYMFYTEEEAQEAINVDKEQYENTCTYQIVKIIPTI